MENLEINCPTCGEKHQYSLANVYRPFCSQHCQDSDFCAWANEEFRMPVAADQPEDESLIIN